MYIAEESIPELRAVTERKELIDRLANQIKLERAAMRHMMFAPNSRQALALEIKEEKLAALIQEQTLYQGHGGQAIVESDASYIEEDPLKYAILTVTKHAAMLEQGTPVNKILLQTDRNTYALIGRVLAEAHHKDPVNFETTLAYALYLKNGIHALEEPHIAQDILNKAVNDALTRSRNVIGIKGSGNAELPEGTATILRYAHQTMTNHPAHQDISYHHALCIMHGVQQPKSAPRAFHILDELANDGFEPAIKALRILEKPTLLPRETKSDSRLVGEWCTEAADGKHDIAVKKPANIIELRPEVA